jgi:Peptidase S24-like
MSKSKLKKKPTVAIINDEAGMAWWNRLTKSLRAEALAAANTDCPAEAWRWHWKASTSGNVEMLGPVHQRVAYTNVQAKDAFALCVENDEMVSGEGESFPPGCLIVVDPTAAARALPGDYVIVRLKDAREAIFRTLEQDGPTLMLRPLNQDYPSMPLPADARIVGVVVEKQESVRVLSSARAVEMANV